MPQFLLLDSRPNFRQVLAAGELNAFQKSVRFIHEVPATPDSDVVAAQPLHIGYGRFFAGNTNVTYAESLKFLHSIHDGHFMLIDGALSHPLWANIVAVIHANPSAPLANGGNNLVALPVAILFRMEGDAFAKHDGAAALPLTPVIEGKRSVGDCMINREGVFAIKARQEALEALTLENWQSHFNPNRMLEVAASVV